MTDRNNICALLRIQFISALHGPCGVLEVPKKLTQEEFLVRAKAIHGNKYCYKKTIYISLYDPVIITCKTHGDFHQKPSIHIYKGGSGCPDCGKLSISKSKIIRFDDVLIKIKKVHKNKYKYIAESYKGITEKIDIICPDHGFFSQLVSSHLKGHGCQECGGVKRLNKELFAEKARKIHGDKYDYSLAECDGNKNKVKIICREHGVFEQIPNTHLSGGGCYDCGNTKKSVTQRASQREFIKRAKEAHGSRYDLSKAKYINNRTKVEIFCFEHGSFLIKPMNFLDREQGCPCCGKVRSGWSRSRYIELTNRYRKGLSSLYIIKCDGAGEVFYKIGITSKRITERFSGKNMPYSYTELKYATSEAGIIWDMEKTLHRLLKGYRYQPKLSFSGQTECFSHIPKKVYKLLNEMNMSKQIQLIT